MGVLILIKQPLVKVRPRQQLVTAQRSSHNDSKDIINLSHDPVPSVLQFSTEGAEEEAEVVEIQARLAFGTVIEEQRLGGAQHAALVPAKQRFLQVLHQQRGLSPGHRAADAGFMVAEVVVDASDEGGQLFVAQGLQRRGDGRQVGGCFGQSAQQLVEIDCCASLFAAAGCRRPTTHGCRRLSI